MSLRRCLPALVALLVGVGAADAQPAGRKARVGVIFNAIPVSELQGAAPASTAALAMQDELWKAGWRLPDNLEILWRSAESDFSRFPALIDDLSRQEVDVMVVGHNELAAM